MTSNLVFIYAQYSDYYQVKSVPRKKSEHCKKDDGQFRVSSVKEQEIFCEIQRFVSWCNVQIHLEIPER